MAHAKCKMQNEKSSNEKMRSPAFICHFAFPVLFGERPFGEAL
jgi:hypothetical protein